MISHMGLGLLIAVGSASYAHADSAADALLGVVAPSAQPQTQVAPGPLVGIQNINLSDPFLMTFFSDWQGKQPLSYETNAWAIRILKGEFAPAAHQWSSIQNHLPENFIESARAAWLYTLWKLDLPQTFVDQWVLFSQNPSFASHRARAVLNQILAGTIDRWMTDHQVTITDEHRPYLERLGASQDLTEMTLHALTKLRRGEEAIPILKRLPAGHALKIPLAQTAVLALARQHKLGEAGQILKTEMEPAIEGLKNPLKLSNHYLQVARLLFQSGALDASESYYVRIPNKAPEFMKAREELTWVYLRKGDIAKLRGELKTLESPVFSEIFAPEVPVVRGVSNLKLCYYDQVEKSLKDFVDQNMKWAKKIEDALASASVPVPLRKDDFVLSAERAVEDRKKEAQRLEVLAGESIRAALPAIGSQMHWDQARKRILSFLEVENKRRDSEYRRQWAGYQVVLREALRKMQFVKVEMMTQVSRYSTTEGGGRDQLNISAATAKLADQDENKNKQMFRFDGVYWPDELFRLRSVAQNRCQERVRL